MLECRVSNKNGHKTKDNHPVQTIQHANFGLVPRRAVLQLLWKTHYETNNHNVEKNQVHSSLFSLPFIPFLHPKITYHSFGLLFPSQSLITIVCDTKTHSSPTCCGGGGGWESETRDALPCPRRQCPQQQPQEDTPTTLPPRRDKESAKQRRIDIAMERYGEEGMISLMFIHRHLRRHVILVLQHISIQ